MRTTVAVVNGPGAEFVLEAVEVDGPRADEVLVRIVATGLCHTDLSLRDTLPAEMFPRVFGHEGAGVVEEVGADVTGIAVGDHVVLSLASCRGCAKCQAGQAGYCEQTLMLNYMGFRTDGSTSYSREGGPVYGHFFGQSSFARHAVALASSVVVVDPSLDLTRIAPYGCGFMAGSGAVLNVAQPGPGDSVAVYGVGAVGLAAVAAARASGVGTVVAVDLQARRLEAAERLGAIGVDPAGLGETTVVERVKELTGGGATYGIETTAVPSVLKEAAQSLGVQGTLVVLGLDMSRPEFPVDAIDLLQNGKVVRGSVEGDSDPQEMVPRMLRMNAEGRLPLDDLVTTYPFGEINSAIADVLAGRVVKPVLVW
ncbi:NAD(P)-dependent alcohol dehydrogenase [Nocardioides sp.]|uniref:NAD(P)-dependent alcohol dehydrogenase n=1 Tax=Nocardioides sp. TaxID=35761 RepID=UPI00262B41C3|nr:NAD(P)-dependent alcohol dehydrogenase [Nocardioides sp.]MDI6910219.1 NAD(P)-dependent alcohol dehydrogenase [Nocardioides sp.]